MVATVVAVMGRPRHEYFDGNLVAALKKPAKVCQATRLTKEQWDEVLPHYQPDDPFHDFTGCRPQEMEVMAARRLDLAAMKVRFEEGGCRARSTAATWNCPTRRRPCSGGSRRAR